MSITQQNATQIATLVTCGAMLCFVLYLFKDDKVKEIPQSKEVVQVEASCKYDRDIIEVLRGSNSPLSVRNNNPINIKYYKSNHWVGQDYQYKGQFVKFMSPEDGISASIKVIKANIQSTKSVREFVNRIVAEDDLNSKHIKTYIRYLESNLGYKGKIKKHDASKVLEIMVILEGGEVANSYFNKYYNCKGKQ